MATNKRPAAKEQIDDRLAYLHALGLTDKTAADLEAPRLDDFGVRASDDFTMIGDDVHPGFEYYRAVSDRSATHAEALGYFRLPSDVDARFKGCHTEGEIMMARTREVGDAYRKAEHARRLALRSGKTSGSTPMGGGAVFQETTDHSHVSVNTKER